MHTCITWENPVISMCLSRVSLQNEWMILGYVHTHSSEVMHHVAVQASWTHTQEPAPFNSLHANCVWWAHVTHNSVRITSHVSSLYANLLYKYTALRYGLRTVLRGCNILGKHSPDLPNTSVLGTKIRLKVVCLACSQAPPSFPSPAVRKSVQIATESWAGPGNGAKCAHAVP